MNETILKQVLDALGTPPGLARMGALNVFNNSWRVNLWCERPGTGHTSTKPITSQAIVADYHIPHSFFVTVDEHGHIIHSTPEIARRYPREAVKLTPVATATCA